MSKLKEDITPGYFLVISNWAGLSKTPGSTGMFVYPDGKYILKRVYQDYSADGRKENILLKEGTLNDQELKSLEAYAEKNIIVSSSRVIFDAGCTVEVIKNGTVVTIENDREIYDKVSELLNFKTKYSELK